MALSNAKIFLFSLISFMVGIFVGPFFGYSRIVFIFLFIILVLIGLAGRKERLTLTLAVCFFFLFLGIFRYQISIPQNNPETVQYYNGQKIKLIGIVSSEPDIRGDKINLVVSSISYQASDQERELRGKILVQTKRYPEYNYGDELEISGKLQQPGEFEDFSYKEYLLPKGIYSVIYWPEAKILAQNKGNFIYKYLFQLKRHFTETLEKILPEPQSSLLTGLLYGARRKIPQELMESFNKTATSHIVAISGFNITIIVLALGRLAHFFLFSRKLAAVLTTLIIFLFIAICGFSASVVRAAIMGGMVLFAKLIGRKSQPLSILIFTAGLMIFFNPFILRYDLSFQLSFLSTLGLVLLSERVISWFSSLPKFFAEPLGLTLSAYLFTLPLLLYQFGRLSLVALPANALILEIIPSVMLLGFLSGALGLILLPLGKIIGFLSWSLLNYIIWVVRIFANMPFSSFNLGRFNFSAVIIYYFFLFLAFRLADVKKIGLFFRQTEA